MFDDGRYEKSASGDFYIELHESDNYGGCCTAAWPPHENAPGLCTFEEFGKKRYCYVKKQPETDFEIYKMIRALWACEFECLKYVGSNRGVLQRLAEIGTVLDGHIDERDSSKRVLRNVCTYSLKKPQESAVSVGKALRALLLKGGYKDSYQATEIEMLNESSIQFNYSWTAGEWRKRLRNYTEPIYHQIIVDSSSRVDDEWIIVHSMNKKQVGGIAMSLSLDDFLRELDGVEDIRWYSEEEWNDGKPTFWRSTPY